jgi:tRNA(Ile)-lysidine synthase
VLVAVSGGQDSLCLVRLLLDLQPKWDWQLAIAHCDHRWRSDSGANAEYVASLAQEWSLPCHLETAKQIAHSEAEARQWRYGMLAEIAEQHKYSAVVTGHTASDRAETLLYNLLRGSGMDGLQALTWKRSLSQGVQLVRPLLEFARGETAQFCQERDLQVWEDSTNQDLGYARNRIRQELLPYLQAHFNPQVESTLAQTAELLQAEVEYLETVARELLQQAQLPQQTGRTGQPGLNQRVLQSAPLALQRRVVRLFLQQALPSMPSFQDIEKLTNLIPAPNRSQTDPFPGGEIARVEGDWIWMTELEGEKRGGREGGGDRETGRWGE